MPDDRGLRMGRNLTTRNMKIRKWIGLLALLAAFPPLSTDMYLPSLPTLSQEWNQPLWVINLTLIGFFITYSVFMLLYGPISDRYGRRRLLKIGIPIYVVSSLCCAAAPGAISLIFFRIFQAAGGACASSLALAISRDVFDFREREQVLAYIGVIVALCPMLAPVIGGWMMAQLSWRWIFVALAGLGGMTLIGVCRMPESLPSSDRTPEIQIFASYLRLIQNPAYLGMVLIISISTVPVFAFIAASSDIYMTRYGLSAQVYGFLFGFNAVALMAGAIACIRLNRRISSHRMLSISFAWIAMGGALLLLIPFEHPLVLTLPMFLISFAIGMSRPPGNNLVLQQVTQYAGSASSLLMFLIMTSGAGAMGLISLGWSDKIQVLGFMGLVCGSLSFLGWRKFIHIQPKDGNGAALQ